jgi:hypothetical protein
MKVSILAVLAGLNAWAPQLQCAPCIDSFPSLDPDQQTPDFFYRILWAPVLRLSLIRRDIRAPDRLCRSAVSCFLLCVAWRCRVAQGHRSCAGHAPTRGGRLSMSLLLFREGIRRDRRVKRRPSNGAFSSSLVHLLFPLTPRSYVFALSPRSVLLSLFSHS